MLRCVRCGTQNLGDSQFCDECGNGLTSAEKAATTTTSAWQSGRLTMIEETTANNDFGQTMTVSPDSFSELSADQHELSAQTTVPPIVASAAVAMPAFGYARLIIERGKNAGKEFVLSETEINIGRWDADNGVFPDVDLDADDPEAKVSRRHARIVRYGNQHLVEDLGSTNGTFINRGRRLLPGNRQIIEDGDEIIVGKTFLRFQVIR